MFSLIYTHILLLLDDHCIIDVYLYYRYEKIVRYSIRYVKESQYAQTLQQEWANGYQCVLIYNYYTHIAFSLL